MTSGFDTIIAGSGPAGLAAAVGASAAGKRVLLLEQLSSPGCKLLASGGGRCNVSNNLVPAQFSASFGKKQRFVRHALYTFPPEFFRKFFASCGVPWELTDGFHYFPASGRARDILDALLNTARDNGVMLRTRTPLAGLLTADGKVTGVRCPDRCFYAEQVILACGGNSYPALGGTGGGYAAAAAAGHQVTEVFPAMVGLQTAETWVTELAGISLPDVQSTILLPGEKEKCRGELLFTKTGISAFAVLDISGRVSELLAQHEVVPMQLSLTPEIGTEEWKNLFNRWQKEYGNRSVGRQLAEYFPRHLIEKRLDFHSTRCANLSAIQRQFILNHLVNFTVQITGTDGWNKAMVTRGGVALDEVDPRTMESRLVKGLFFAGEVLDVDGKCGGYNIQWALSSGFLAGGNCKS